MLNKFLFGISLISTLLIVSCKKNDNNSPTATPPRDVTEVRNENNAAIENFLKTHSLTYSSTASFDAKVTFATTTNTTNAIWGNSDLKKLELDVYDDNNNKIRHKLYYMILQQGTGTTTTIADLVYVNYKGQLLNLSVFDETVSLSQRNWIDLIGDITDNKKNGTIKGFAEGVSLLKASSGNSLENGSGGFLVPPSDCGIGVFFIPSGLGYFNANQAKIPAYSPLIYTVQLIGTTRADHDSDGIPSINEIRRDNYGIVTFPNCNAAKETVYKPDYLDPKNCD